jgi:hypothetical protein
MISGDSLENGQLILMEGKQLHTCAIRSYTHLVHLLFCRTKKESVLSNGGGGGVEAEVEVEVSHRRW